jgi:ribosome-binding factor A
MNRRLVRVSEVVRAELARLLARDRLLADALITFTSVEVTPDLRQAFVYFSSMNDEFQEDEILRLFEKVRHDWQTELGKRIEIKYTPRLIFRADSGQKRGDRIMELLNQLDTETEAAKPAPAPAKRAPRKKKSAE